MSLSHTLLPMFEDRADDMGPLTMTLLYVNLFVLQCESRYSLYKAQKPSVTVQLLSHAGD